jgi:hypothetical protein
MDSIRMRFPALRQAALAKAARTSPNPSTVFEPSRISQLAQAAPSWWKVASRRRLYFLLFPAAIVSYATSGYDGSMMNSLQTVSYWDDFFGNPRGATLGLMSAIMALGSICSTPLAPIIADRYGRRWGITTGSVIMIIGAILQCESVNFAMFVISRFMLGFGLTFCTTAAPSLVTELSHPKERVTVTAICNTCCKILIIKIFQCAVVLTRGKGFWEVLLRLGSHTVLELCQVHGLGEYLRCYRCSLVLCSFQPFGFCQNLLAGSLLMIVAMKPWKH